MTAPRTPDGPRVDVTDFGIRTGSPPDPCIVVIFGAGRLPQLGKGLGEGIHNFRDSLKSKEEKPAIEEPKKQS